MKSQTVMSFISKGLFGVLMIGLIVLNASYGIRFVTRLFPDNLVIQFASLVIFDGGALVWFLVFLYMAEGVAQRGISVIGTVIDLLGAGMIAFAEVFTSGQGFVALDADTVKWLQIIVTYAIPLWVILNVIFTYGFHMTSPGMTLQMKARTAQDQLLEHAFHLVEKKMGANSERLAEHMSDDMVTGVLRALRLPENMSTPSSRSRSLPENSGNTLPARNGNGGSRPFGPPMPGMEDQDFAEFQAQAGPDGQPVQDEDLLRRIAMKRSAGRNGRQVN